MTIKRLRPIQPLRRVTKAELKQVATHFERRAKGMTTAAELAAQQKGKKEEKGKTNWTTEESVNEFLELSRAINDAGRFTDEQYFFHCAAPVERLHEHRWIKGDYNDKLEPVSTALRKIETEHGLSSDQYWPPGQGPAKYRTLNDRYSKILDAELEHLFRAFGLKRHARLWKRTRKEYQRLREGGRAHVFDFSDVEHATAKLIVMYEEEAKRCVKAKAFHAACIMLGSACESLILLKCLRDPAHLAKAQAQLPKSKGFHKGGPTYWNLGQLVEIAKLAGWVADLESLNVVIHIVNLVARLQSLRNLVHAGRHAADLPHISVGREQYDDARSAYLALRYALETVDQRKS